MGALLSGCPSGACFLEICHGKSCQCSLSSCGDGAGYDTQQNRCRCVKGFFDVTGQCLDQQQANTYCGPGYGFAGPAGGGPGGGCVKLECRPGDTLDQRTGFCIPKNQVAQQSGVELAAGQTLGCAGGEVLVVDGGNAACVPAAQSCAKDEIWNGQACQKTVACPTGQVFDAALGRCAVYASSGGSELVVDVAQWTFSTYGPPNGPGTASFCNSFAKKPLSFGLKAGSSALVRVSVQVSFPDGAIKTGRVQTTAVYEGSGNPVPAPGAADVQAAAQGSFGALVAGGGKASAASAATTVKCSVVNASAPLSVPESGGF